MFSLTPSKLRARPLHGGPAGYRGDRSVSGGESGGNSRIHRSLAALAVAARDTFLRFQGLDFGAIFFATRVRVTLWEGYG
jgi:hypothetical protein